MSKAVSYREICFIKTVLLLFEHGHFKKIEILLGLIWSKTKIYKHFLRKEGQGQLKGEVKHFLCGLTQLIY